MKVNPKSNVHPAYCYLLVSAWIKSYLCLFHFINEQYICLPFMDSSHVNILYHTKEPDFKLIDAIQRWWCTAIHWISCIMILATWCLNKNRNPWTDSTTWNWSKNIRGISDLTNFNNNRKITRLKLQIFRCLFRMFLKNLKKNLH